jgi:hypothetical protein
MLELRHKSRLVKQLSHRSSVIKSVGRARARLHRNVNTQWLAIAITTTTNTATTPTVHAHKHSVADVSERALAHNVTKFDLFAHDLLGHCTTVRWKATLHESLHVAV